MWPFLDPWDVVGRCNTANSWTHKERAGHPQGDGGLWAQHSWEEKESCTLCDLRMMGVMSSGTFSDEKYEEHNLENFFLEVVEQGGSCGLVYFFFDDWELARVALSCHLASDLLCQGMQEVG